MSQQGIKAWSGLILTCMLAGLSAFLTAFVYAHQNFMTVREKQDLSQRLDRIESKIDHIIEYQYDRSK